MKSLSYSKIRLWEECELKFCAHELLGMQPEVPVSSVPRVQLGTLLHNLFYKFYAEQSRQLNLFINKASLAEQQIKFIEQSKTLVANDKTALEKGLLAIENFYKHEETREFRPPRLLETRFSLQINDFTVTGIIDRVDEEADGELVLIDYKISESVRAQNKVDEDLQLTIYALACKEALLGKAPNKLKLFYPLQNVFIETERTDEHFESLKEYVGKITATIEKRGPTPELYEAKPAEWKCAHCGYVKHCQAVE